MTILPAIMLTSTIIVSPYITANNINNNRINNIEVSVESEEQETEEVIENAIQREENPQIVYIYERLKEAGLSKASACGIIGNIMTEVGGWENNAANMDINVFATNKIYYGMCQWNKKLYAQVVDCDLEQQCNFLIETLPVEFSSFGKLSGYSYSEFISIQDAETAAKAFAKSYERCSASTIKRRQNCARIAYNYLE